MLKQTYIIYHRGRNVIPLINQRSLLNQENIAVSIICHGNNSIDILFYFYWLFYWYISFTEIKLKIFLNANEFFSHTKFTLHPFNVGLLLIG